MILVPEVRADACANACSGYTAYACAKTSELSTTFAAYNALRNVAGDGSCGTGSGYYCYCLTPASSNSGTGANCGQLCAGHGVYMCSYSTPAYADYTWVYANAGCNSGGYCYCGDLKSSGSSGGSGGSSSPSTSCQTVCTNAGYSDYGCWSSTSYTGYAYAQSSAANNWCWANTGYNYCLCTGGSSSNTCTGTCRGFPCGVQNSGEVTGSGTCAGGNYCCVSSGSGSGLGTGWACSSGTQCQSGYCAPSSTSPTGLSTRVCCPTTQPCGLIVGTNGYCYAGGQTYNSYVCNSNGLWTVGGNGGSGQICYGSQTCTGGQFCCIRTNGGYPGVCCASMANCNTATGTCTGGSGNGNTACTANIVLKNQNYCEGDDFDLSILSTCNGVPTDISASTLDVQIYRADTGATNTIYSSCFGKLSNGNIVYNADFCGGPTQWGPPAARVITVSGTTTTGVAVSATKQLTILNTGSAGCNSPNNGGAGDCPFKTCASPNSGSAGWSCTCGTNANANAANPYCCPTANGGIGGAYATPAACTAVCGNANGNCQITCPTGDNLLSCVNGQCTVTCGLNGGSISCSQANLVTNGNSYTCNDANCQNNGNANCGTNCVANQNCQCSATMHTDANHQFCCSTTGLVYAQQSDCTTACTGGTPGTTCANTVASAANTAGCTCGTATTTAGNTYCCAAKNMPLPDAVCAANPATCTQLCNGGTGAPTISCAACVHPNTCQCTISGCNSGFVIGWGLGVNGIVAQGDIGSNPYIFPIPTLAAGTVNVKGACWGTGATGSFSSTIQVI